VHIALSILAWLGTASYLLSYLLVSRNRVDPTGWAYQGMNIFGGVTLSAYAVEQRTWPSLALNAAWLAIGVHTVAAARRQRVELTSVA
jgi:hypothetical protein